MLTTLRKAEYAELMILFFIQAAAMAIWFVPLGPILDAHDLHGIKPYAFAASAVNICARRVLNVSRISRNLRL